MSFRSFRNLFTWSPSVPRVPSTPSSAHCRLLLRMNPDGRSRRCLRHCQRSYCRHDTQKCGVAGTDPDDSDDVSFGRDARPHLPQCPAGLGSSGDAVLLAHLCVWLLQRNGVLFHVPPSADVMILARTAPACVNPVGKPSSAGGWLLGGLLTRLLAERSRRGSPFLPRILLTSRRNQPLSQLQSVHGTETPRSRSPYARLSSLRTTPQNLLNPLGGNGIPAVHSAEECACNSGIRICVPAAHDGIHHRLFQVPSMEKLPQRVAKGD